MRCSSHLEMVTWMSLVMSLGVWLPTPATAKVFSLEMQHDCVNPMVCGVDQSPCAKVSIMKFKRSIELMLTLLTFIVVVFCNETLSSPQNGAISVPCITVGCKATYSCNNQSILTGNSIRQCQINGLWNGSSPVCQITVGNIMILNETMSLIPVSLSTAPFCNETLLSPGNGGINVSCNTVGCMATYSCNNISTLTGIPTRVCQQNGLWSGSSPVCQGTVVERININS